MDLHIYADMQAYLDLPSECAHIYKSMQICICNGVHICISAEHPGNLREGQMHATIHDVDQIHLMWSNLVRFPDPPYGV